MRQKIPNPRPASANPGTVLVSEYQYRDFRTIDRPPAKKEMAAYGNIVPYWNLD
jgi:hypothetical protein